MTKTQKEVLEEMNEELKINLGAGRERLKGWKSLDVNPKSPPKRVDTTYGALSTDDLPDIVSVLPKIPVPSGSVNMLRSRDLLMDYESAGFSIARLGREIRRVLKKGGKMITIEVPGFERSLSPYLRVVSVVPGGVAPYFKGMSKEGLKEEGIEWGAVPGGHRYLVTTYIKD